MWPKLDRRVFLAAYALGLGAIAVLSLMPYGVELPEVPQSDKLAHFAAYALVGLAGGLAGGPGAAGRRMAVGLALFAALCGIGLEAAQALVPGRFTSILDACANAAAAASGLAGALALRARRPAWLRHGRP